MERISSGRGRREFFYKRVAIPGCRERLSQNRVRSKRLTFRGSWSNRAHTLLSLALDHLGAWHSVSTTLRVGMHRKRLMMHASILVTSRGEWSTITIR